MVRRGGFDTEYEKVRRAAGLSKPQYEFPEESAATGQHASDRVGRAHQDFKDRMAAIEAHDSRKRAEASIRTDRLTARANESVLRSEYEFAGVKPIATTPDGRPLVSLPLLLSLGWTIERIGNENVLLKPVGPPPPREGHRPKRPEPKPEPPPVDIPF